MAPSAHPWNKRGFSTREAAEYIGRSPSWLRKKRLRGIDDPGDPGPRYLKTDSGSAIYLKENLDEWLDSLAEQSRPQAPDAQVHDGRSRLRGGAEAQDAGTRGGVLHVPPQPHR